MTKKKEPSKKTVDIASFFITSRENEGVWFEPIGSGFELKVLGNGSDEVIAAGAEYIKAHEKVLAMDDLAAKQIAERDAVCVRIAKSVKGIRGKDGAELSVNGKPVVYSKELILLLMKENPAIRADVLKFSSDPDNYAPEVRTPPAEPEKNGQE